MTDNREIKKKKTNVNAVLGFRKNNVIPSCDASPLILNRLFKEKNILLL